MSSFSSFSSFLFFFLVLIILIILILLSVFLSFSILYSVLFLSILSFWGLSSNFGSLIIFFFVLALLLIILLLILFSFWLVFLLSVLSVLSILSILLLMLLILLILLLLSPYTIMTSVGEGSNFSSLLFFGIWEELIVELKLFDLRILRLGWYLFIIFLYLLYSDFHGKKAIIKLARTLNKQKLIRKVK